MKKIVSAFILALLILTSLSAQDYKTGIGLRGGFAQGLTFKYFISDKSALEGILETRWEGFDITGLYEIHNQAFAVEHLNWYYGFGAHIGSYASGNAPWGTSGVVIGIDGILGLEYSFHEAPINIGIDWKPTFNLIGNQDFRGDGGALSIRYIF